MAHLPQSVQDKVTPFLTYCGQEFSSELWIFNALEESKRCLSRGRYKEEPVTIDLLNKYQYWFRSFDRMDQAFYDFLETKIEDFNAKTEGIQLELTSIKGGTESIICGSDSDNYGTYYFLITAVDSNEDHFSYTLPRSLIKSEWDGSENYEWLEICNQEIQGKCNDDFSSFINNDGEVQQVTYLDDYYQEWGRRKAYFDAVKSLANPYYLTSNYTRYLEELKETVRKGDGLYQADTAYVDKNLTLDQLTRRLIKCELNSGEFYDYWTQIQNIRGKN